MTRVSSFGRQQVMLASLMDRQANVFNDQEQITTGKKAKSYGGLASEVTTLLGAKTVIGQTQGYLGAANHVNRFLRTNDIQLGSVVNNAQNIRESILNAISQQQTLTLNGSLGQAFTSTVGALNAKIGGVQVFGGGRTNVVPVTGKSISDLVAATSVTNLFQNDQRSASAKIGPNTTMKYGLLADKVGKEVIQVFKNIADYNAGPSGPLSGKLNNSQISFLKGQLTKMDTALDNLRILVARNGTRQKNVDSFIKENKGQEAFLKVFISDIEDVNVAEAITRLNNDRTALEASFRITSRLTGLSLLKFL